MTEYDETHLTFGALMIKLTVPFTSIASSLMAGGRPRSPEPYVQWKIHIDASIAARIELLFFDRVRGKPKYGSRHELINELLSKYLEEHSATRAAS